MEQACMSEYIEYDKFEKFMGILRKDYTMSRIN